ncbi:MAG: dihydroorotase [Candidatus Syntrophoarchaeum sp. GoM_oil]|nr:MAG: dihydroorotase [Candidatus Syntrophoarchaeum sp. GoM_oil]
MSDLIIRNARAYIDGRLIDADIRIEDGRIVEIKKDIQRAADSLLDLKGLLLLPGAIDVHVHMRDGRQAHKEDWFTGTSAAAAGGVTTVIDQPNTDPPITTRKRLDERIKRASSMALVDFQINGGVDKPENFEELYEGGARAFGEIFQYKFEPDSLKPILDKIHDLGAIATIHAEKKSCVDKNPDRPHNCEIEGIKDALFINRGGRMHFCHISVPQGVDLIKSEGGGATLEVTPHHLFLCDKDRKRLGGLGWMNPPLRSGADRKGLWERLDRIDIIASDHAPHTLEEKLMENPPPGVPGVETLLPLMLYRVKKGDLTLNRLVKLVSVNPASIFGLDRSGKKGISVGGDADLIVVDMDDERAVKEDELHSKCGWTPYEGTIGIFPQMTLVRGEVVYERSCGVDTSRKGWGGFLD